MTYVGGFTKCEVDGCNAKVMRGSPHTKCQHHRPREVRARKQPYTKEREDRMRRRATWKRQSVGVPSWW